MKIILSTDFSEENKVLLPYAIDFLRNAGGEIIIFHAYMDNICIGSNCYPGNMDSDNYLTTEIMIELEKNSQKIMKEKTEFLVNLIKEEGLDNISIRPVLVSGDPEEELIELSKAENPDLILMGTRGKGGKRFLEGSLVKSVMTKCDVPMLFIPEGYNWRKSNEVVYTTNFNDGDVATIDRIFNILKPYKPHIHVIHFVEESDRPREAVLMDELESTFKKKEYEKLFKPLNIKVHYIYIFNNWFKHQQYKDVLEYIHSVDCEYYFNEIPFESLGLEKDNN